MTITRHAQADSDAPYLTLASRKYISVQTTSLILIPFVLRMKSKAFSFMNWYIVSKTTAKGSVLAV
jgi:hypothetical protein